MIPERFQALKKKAEKKRINIAVAYLRVSTDDQSYNESLPTQRKRVQEYADREGIKIIKWFIDGGQSGKTIKKRDAMQEMLGYCIGHKGEIGYVVVYKMQRSSRDLMSYMADFKSLLIKCDLVIRSATEHIDETPIGQYLEGVYILNGQLDNHIKGEVTTDNMESVAAKGWWQTGPIPGYDTVKVKVGPKKTHTILRKNRYIGNVEHLLRMFETGQYTQADIVRMAREREVKNYMGKYLDDNAVYRMLTQPAYAGFICNKLTNYELVKGRHEAIISLDTFNRIQQIIENSKRKKKGEPKQKNHELYPLKPLLLCHSCGQQLRGSGPKTGAGGHSPRYHCSRASCKGSVRSVSVQAVHKLFATYLEQVTPDEGLLRLYKEILRRHASNHTNNIIKQIEDGLSAVAKLEDERVRILRDASLTRNEKDDVLRAIENDTRRLKKQAEELEEKQTATQAAIDQAIAFMHDAQAMWVNADLPHKQWFQNMLFPQGLTFDTMQLQLGTNDFAQLSPLYRYAPSKKALSGFSKTQVVTPAGVEPAIFRMRT